MHTGIETNSLLQNISREEDPFVPTSEDLAGFWDMVYIQVEHINALFAELATLRKNGWVSKKPLVRGIFMYPAAGMYKTDKFSPSLSLVASITVKVVIHYY